jgi:hypothetical protein
MSMILATFAASPQLAACFWCGAVAYCGPMKDRLDLRLYFDPAYSAMAKAIGYAGVSVPEAKKKIETLAKRFPREKLVTVIEDIARIEGPKGPNEEGAVFLTDEAKKLCWQLLGPPPGHPDHAEAQAESAAEKGRKTKKGRGK